MLRSHSDDVWMSTFEYHVLIPLLSSGAMISRLDKIAIFHRMTHEYTALFSRHCVVLQGAKIGCEQRGIAISFLWILR